ncbi:bifunctional 3-phenylpropionate/cinnamic acid dioxygenase ferredoxin subunit [Dactylosporangium sp. CA-233914]|uniref:bifunctional 3-phenylpropionate/cinnamic acid dioxygenase ferredoxin subunit n=1 Tax=Dactylosporangium sp. CA-233914 TaxID=3239934 RepID=UPI003D901B63
MPQIRACNKEDLPQGEALQVPHDPPIAVFNVDGEFYATDDTCTHDRWSLATDGYIDGDIVECSWHMAKFSIKTGEVKSLPARCPLRTYPVRVDGDGDVYITV